MFPVDNVYQKGHAKFWQRRLVSGKLCLAEDQQMQTVGHVVYGIETLVAEVWRLIQHSG